MKNSAQRRSVRGSVSSVSSSAIARSTSNSCPRKQSSSARGTLPPFWYSCTAFSSLSLLSKYLRRAQAERRVRGSAPAALPRQGPRLAHSATESMSSFPLMRAMCISSESMPASLARRMAWRYRLAREKK